MSSKCSHPFLTVSAAALLCCAFSLLTSAVPIDVDHDGLMDTWEQNNLGGTGTYTGRDNPEGDPHSLLQEMATDGEAFAFDQAPTVNRVSIDGFDWMTLTYRESAIPGDTVLAVAESVNLEDWEVFEVDGIQRIIEVMDADPDGDGSAVQKRFRRKLTGDGPVYLRLTVAVRASSPWVIDDFSADQAPAFENPSSNQADTESYLEHSSILGGERDLEVLAEPGSISAGVSEGTLNVAFGANTSGQVIFVWDGVDGTSSDPLLIGDRTRGDMIGPVDAALAGYNAIRMVFSQASAEFPLSLQLSTSQASSHYTDASFSTPFRIPQGGGEVVVPFSEVKFPTYSKPNLADIRGVRLSLRYLGSSNPLPNSFQLDKIEFVYIE